jgi:hypothetical protein
MDVSEKDTPLTLKRTLDGDVGSSFACVATQV